MNKMGGEGVEPCSELRESLVLPRCPSDTALAGDTSPGQRARVKHLLSIGGIPPGGEGDLGQHSCVGRPMVSL